MGCVINNQVVLSRPPEGPLAAYIVSFAKSQGEQGYSLGSLKQQVRIAAGFSRWLQQKQVNLHSICSDHSVQYLRYRARHVRPCLGDVVALRHLLDFLHRDDVIPIEKISAPRLSSAERCALPTTQSDTATFFGTFSGRAIPIGFLPFQVISGSAASWLIERFFEL